MKSEDLSFTPWTHVVEGPTDSLELSSDSYRPIVTHRFLASKITQKSTVHRINVNTYSEIE